MLELGDDNRRVKWLLVDLFHEARPVTDGGIECACVDEVKELSMCPWAFAVVDLEMNIRRNTSI